MPFVRKLVRKPGQADEVIELVKADSDVAAAVNKEYMTFKEVERPKFKPGRMREQRCALRLVISRTFHQTGTRQSPKPFAVRSLRPELRIVERGGSLRPDCREGDPARPPDLQDYRGLPRFRESLVGCS